MALHEYLPLKWSSTREAISLCYAALGGIVHVVDEECWQHAGAVPSGPAHIGSWYIML